MPKPMVYHLNNELFDILQLEIKELHQEVAAITMEKFNNERYYEDLVAEERKEKQDLLLEIQELKEKLEKDESMNQGLVGRDETTCCPTIQELQEEIKDMKKKHRQEIEMLTIEYEIDVAVAQKEVKKLQEKLKTEKHLGAKRDSAKSAAIKIPSQFSSLGEGLKRVSTEQSTEIKVPDEDIPYLDVCQLQEMLRRERNLRIQAENENLDQFKCAEAFFEMMEQELKTERERRAEIEADKQEAVEIAEQLIKNLEDMEKMSKAGPTENTSVDKDKIQLELQEMEKTIQNEKALRVQAENLLEILEQERKTEEELRAQIEADKEEAVEIAEQLLKKLEDMQKTSEKNSSKITMNDLDKFKLEVQQLENMLQEEKRLRDLEKAYKMTATLSTDTELLTKNLQAEDKKQRFLLKDIKELTLMLEKEKSLRIKAEDYEMETIEIVEALEKEAKYRTQKNKYLKKKHQLIK
ncbi:hypothetical protein CCH79_00016569, partial [Gambusia affinis]